MLRYQTRFAMTSVKDVVPMAFSRRLNLVTTISYTASAGYIYLRKMNSEEVIHNRNSLWRRISKNVTQVNISSLARNVRKAFGRIAVCGSRNETLSLASEEDFNTNKPIYIGPKIEVPWKGEVFKYPSDRYLTNQETLKQLNLLELRFRAQSKILQEKKEKIESELDEGDRQKREAMKRTIKESNLKFAKIRNLVMEFKKFVSKKRRERLNATKEENS